MQIKFLLNIKKIKLNNIHYKLNVFKKKLNKLLKVNNIYYKLI